MAVRLAHDVRGERAVAGGRRAELAFGPDGAAARVPAVLLLPAAASRAASAPGAVLLHGFTSRKEQMADTVGAALLRRGLATLAIDLPLHGERVAEGRVDRSTFGRNPLALAGAWRDAQREATLALGYLGARPEVDRDRLAVVGYSMGSFLGVQVAAAEPRVRALVLAAGGDLPEGTPFAAVVRALADPLRAVRRFDGRPLLMVHGRRDPTVTAAQAQRLFDAAQEPKEIRWYDAGHYLPTQALDDAGEWLVSRLNYQENG
ncbi:alpha/beta hydrolase [Roseisolibacter sp. H3M3-2]|uniref:alpha/beta hydrolase n=1 Tax=Roseisolibacter sp. H3M3-2 TaxID=3031323 RepID=UPI0023DAAD43|nr:alpha/beta hydrolase [Roseisolibacter sp. H3M3-2]MDF1505874.1 alpha/beta hydrolase [Roseisolibacter sp. H3M3-2]